MTAALAPLAACGTRIPPAPAAEAIVVTADSSYWVTSDRKGLRMRGEPILITRLEGRFRELYVVDDDRSFPDAVLVGQRLFARDLVRGDSVELFADSVVPRLAREYARAHPNEAPLEPDEEASADPRTTATADLELLDVHGPYLSFEYHSDVDIRRERGGIDRHVSRRGVLDLRTGRSVTVAALFGPEAADRALALALAEWESVRDSALARRGPGDDEARRTVRALAFDASSFSLEARDREPLVVFAVPAESRQGPTPPLALSPQRVPGPPWWRDASAERPAGPDSALSWRHEDVELVARAADGADRATLALRDTSRREWALGSVTAPVQRVLWLDAGVSAEARQALRRAFDESSLASEGTRVALSRQKQKTRTSS